MATNDTGSRDGGLCLLAIGAHPDDIEIGAAGLIAKARERGHLVYFLALTDDDAHGPRRRAEAVRAAAAIGVEPSNVLFAGFRDGYLRADGDSVGRVRRLVRSHDIVPDLVVTHTQADSHNDHVEANRIAHAAFRDTMFLHFSIHVSAEVDRFSPRVFVHLGPARQRMKDRALGCFPSQESRITRQDLGKYEAELGRLARLDRAEGFEVSRQYGAQDTVLKTIGLSDSSFHRFWEPVVSEGAVSLLYESYDWRSARTLIHQNAARDTLRQAFIDFWPPPYPLREQYANTDEALTIASGGNIIATGAVEANQIAKRLRDSGSLAWSVEGGLHDDHRYLLDQRTGKRHDARTRRHLGCLARIESPFSNGTCVVTAAGVTDFATRTGVEHLADPSRSADLMNIFDQDLCAQLAYAVDPVTGELEVLDIHRGNVSPKGSR